MTNTRRTRPSRDSHPNALAGLLTPGLVSTAFSQPIRCNGTIECGNSSPSYSGGAVPESHRVPSSSTQEALTPTTNAQVPRAYRKSDGPSSHFVDSLFGAVGRCRGIRRPFLGNHPRRTAKRKRQLRDRTPKKNTSRHEGKRNVFAGVVSIRGCTRNERQC